MMSQTERAIMIASQAGNGERLLNDAGAIFALTGSIFVAGLVVLTVGFFGLIEIIGLIIERAKMLKNGQNEEPENDEK